MVLLASQCWSCRHYVSGLFGAVGRPHCAAFPEGIPHEVIRGSVDHREPYPGDNGIRWESNGRPWLDLPPELRDLLGL
ncbi:hypothetical protein [Micromonospora okii]|uniref:hypothetical protein n=1 Tax=Micromonospora okii TaxID=1182970 RepID=UPI001E60F23B|nr:hypothetical protein [Micromonospora okii]